MIQPPYDIIIADPPWHYQGQQQHGGAGSDPSGSAQQHYPTMTVTDMVQEISPANWSAADCLLFMWATWPHLDQAITLGHGWGFRYVHTPFVWDKQRVNPGYYTMTQTEPVLCFKRGRIPAPRGTRNERQLVSEARTTHSTKPRAVQDRIARMWPQARRLEMFARQPYPGWDAWGNEL